MPSSQTLAGSRCPSGYCRALPRTRTKKWPWVFCRIPLTRNVALLAAPVVQAFDPCGPTVPSAHFCRPVGPDLTPPSVRNSRRTPDLPGKFNRFHRTTAGFSTSPLDGSGRCRHQPTRPAPYPSYPAHAHRLTPSHHASFRPRLATTPFRFASASPPSGCRKGTLAHKLSNMLGTPKERGSGNPLPLVSVRARDEPASLAPRAKASRSWSGRHRTIRSGHWPCSWPPGIPAP